MHACDLEKFATVFDVAELAKDELDSTGKFADGLAVSVNEALLPVTDEVALEALYAATKQLVFKVS